MPQNGNNKDGEDQGERLVPRIRYQGGSCKVIKVGLKDKIPKSRPTQQRKVTFYME